MRRGVHALLSRRCRADTGLFQRAPVSPSSSARLHTHLDARHAANATDIPAFYTLRFGRRATRSSARCVAIPISLVHGMNWTTHRRSNATPAQSGSIAPSCQRNEAQLVLATKQPLQLVGWRKRWRARWRILVRLSELFIFVTPLAATATVLYCLRLVGLRSLTLEDAWWAMALRGVELAGPTFIKLCQWAATRNDIFPVSMTGRFSKLHENVAPHSLEHTAFLLESTFGERWHERLQLTQSSDEVKLLGSGCIAQVYRGSAVDDTGAKRDVAVKVMHPGVREAVALDMALLRWFGETIEALLPSSRYLGVVETLSNFEYLMERQLDLRHEAYNLERLAALFEDDDTVCIPRPIRLDSAIFCGAASEVRDSVPSVDSDIRERRITVLHNNYSIVDSAWPSADVLVEDYIDGKPIQSFVGSETSTATLLARRGAMVLLRMVLQHNFVHGDLHPGNLLVDDSLRICLLDAGICIELPQRAHDNMVAMLRAMLECRGQDAGRLMLASDAANRTRRERNRQNETNFVNGIAAMVERARDQSFFESIAEYYGDICALAIKNRVALDASFVSVALAVKIVEGLVTSLHPNFPILELALPMFLKAQFEHASAERLGLLSAYSRNILKNIGRSKPVPAEEQTIAFDSWVPSA